MDTVKKSRIDRSRKQRILLIDYETLCGEGGCFVGYKFQVLGASDNIYDVFVKSDEAPICSCPDCYEYGNRCKHIYFVLEQVLKLGHSSLTDLDSYCFEEDTLLDHPPSRPSPRQATPTPSPDTSQPKSADESSDEIRELEKIIAESKAECALIDKEIDDRILRRCQLRDEIRMLGREIGTRRTRRTKLTRSRIDANLERLKELRSRKSSQVARREISGDCPICIEAFEKGDECVWCKVCGNNFHGSCMLRYISFVEKPKCPFCRGEWEK